MRVKIFVTAAVLLFLTEIKAKAQVISNATKSNYSKNSKDLIEKFKNSIFKSISNKTFESESYVSTFTTMRIDIDKDGKVKKIKFSDSADTLFVKQYFKSRKNYNDKLILETYIKQKNYKNISIIIPVNYMPLYSPHGESDYKDMDRLMTFDNEQFTGKCIIFTPIIVNEANR